MLPAIDSLQFIDEGLPWGLRIWVPVYAPSLTFRRKRSGEVRDQETSEALENQPLSLSLHLPHVRLGPFSYALVASKHGNFSLESATQPGLRIAVFEP